MNISANRSLLLTTLNPSPWKSGEIDNARSFVKKICPAGGFKRKILTDISMRDRSKNRKPLQRGRMSMEAILTVQALKRGSKHDDCLSLRLVLDSKFKRLLKLDMIAVLRELIRQNECFLALKVFEDIRKEYWYKPRFLLYADMISVLASNGLLDEVKLLLINLKMEPNLEPDIEGFNVLLTNLVTSNVPVDLAMDCFTVMKQSGCELDRSSFRILVNGLELKGENDLSAFVREEARRYFGYALDFFEEREQLTVS